MKNPDSADRIQRSQSRARAPWVLAASLVSLIGIGAVFLLRTLWTAPL